MDGYTKVFESKLARRSRLMCLMRTEISLLCGRRRAQSEEQLRHATPISTNRGNTGTDIVRYSLTSLAVAYGTRNSFWRYVQDPMILNENGGREFTINQKWKLSCN